MFGIKKRHVASGSYQVSGTEPMILQAFLGTCVGVALYDPDTGIGGLMHLLLPEPTSFGNVLFPERYASTGLPVFLKALSDAGASHDNLRATIAGGALVGPLDDRDLNLDIGGRTADVVKKILLKEGIQIEKSETGGFFMCCLGLNTYDWQASIEPAGYEKLPEDPEVHVPDLDEINQAIESLQPIPQVALKILRMMDDGTDDVAALAREVRKDQVLSGRTLQLCNSAMYATRTRIESVNEALILLGQNLFVQLVVSAAIKSFFKQTNSGYSICKGGLYHHALGTAIIAEKLAQMTGMVTPSLAYIAGLLHDIGKVGFDQ